jgi:WD40 repeat protein
VWDAVAGTLLSTLTGHTREVNSVAFNHDGSEIVSGSGDKTFRLWVYNNKTNDWDPIIYEHNSAINAISYSLIKNPYVELFAICSTQSIKFLKVDTKPDDDLLLKGGMGDGIKNKSKKRKSRRNSYRKKKKNLKKEIIRKIKYIKGALRHTI